MKRKNKAILWCCITLLWTGVIFWFSLQPATASANLSGGLLQKLLGWFYQITAIQIPVERAHWLFRKAAHFGEFFLLGIFSGSFFHAIWKKTFPALLYGGLIAFADECLQYLTGEGRAMRFSDMLLDGSGVVCALLFLWVLTRVFPRKKKWIPKQ